MSNVLSPIVARFSLFFTLTMFSSSIISQSRQPTHLVQILLIEAERRYHDNTTKKLRALIRNASTSTSSSSVSKLSSLQTSSATTELSSLSSCKEHSSEEAPTIVLDLSSFPLMSNGEDSSSEKSAEHEGSATVFTLVNEAGLSPKLTTAASRTNANAVSGILNQQHQSQQAQTSSKKHPLNQTVTPSIQKTNVSRSSIATLLSVTLTMILLSLLQNKKRCMRRITRSLREGSRRHRRSKHLHRDGYKSSSPDRFTNPPYSQSSRNSTLTLMDNNTEGCIHPISPFLVHPSHSSTGITTKTSHEPTPYMILNVESDHQSSAPSSPAMPNFESGHNICAANLYGVTNSSWSLSDGHLPEMQTKDDFVEAWLSHQDFTVDNHRTPNESNENTHMSDRQHHHRYHHRHHSQSSSHLPQSSPSLYNKTSHGHLGHHYHSNYYHQHRPVQPLPYWQEHHHHSAHKHIHWNAPENQHPRYDVHQEQNGYIHSQTQHRYDIPNTGNVNLERDHSLSWTRSSTIRSQNNKALPPSPPKQEELSLAEQARQEHQLRRQRYQMHHQYLQQYRQQQQMQQQNYYRKDYQQHTLGPYAHYYHPQNHSKHMSDYDFEQYPIMHHHLPKTRSANELAWERHCYYQQQQHLEEALAEQKRKEVQSYVEQQGLEQDMLHPPGQDPTARTVSLNRISSASLSPNAAQALGLSQSKPVFSISESDDSKPINNRTNTSDKVQDILLPLKESETETPPISDRNKSPRFLQNNGSKDLEATLSKMLAEQVVSNMDSADDVAKDLSLLQPISEIVTQESVTLNRKSTFSIRSLARRCSRFGSRRPNSFAGLSNDPIISLEENNKNFKMSRFVVSELSEALESQPKLQSMIDVTKRSSLITPVTTSFQLLGAAVTKHERVPVHRKVTLFRSEIMAHSNSSQPIFNQEQSVMASETSQRKKSLSTNPRDTSLRLANGHGVDLPALKSRVHPNGTVTKDIEQPTNGLEELIPVEENITHDTSEFEQQDKARRQIIELLGMGRKERISAKTGLTMAARLKTKSSVTTPILTPLALEACQDLSLINPTSTTNEEVDPCEHIAFMLVPKSRYEFQPLVAV